MAERIVVGVDDSAGGRAALAYALREGGLRGAEVEVVGAYARPEYWSGQPVPGWVQGPSPEELRDGVRARVEEIVAEARAGLAGVGATAVRVCVVGGSAAAALLEAADGADLLVVGSRGHGGFASMVLGSVSLQCVLHAPCPVTVVPHSVPTHGPDGRRRVGAGAG
ncbi:MAG: universal stress protein [Pseudonocardia sp.]